MLSLYEVNHGAVNDLVIARSEEEAVTLLERFFSAQVDEPIKLAYNKVTRLPEDLVTITDHGLVSVKQILERYKTPFFYKEG